MILVFSPDIVVLLVIANAVLLSIAVSIKVLTVSTTSATSILFLIDWLYLFLIWLSSLIASCGKINSGKEEELLHLWRAFHPYIICFLGIFGIKEVTIEHAKYVYYLLSVWMFVVIALLIACLAFSPLAIKYFFCLFVKYLQRLRHFTLVEIFSILLMMYNYIAAFLLCQNTLNLLWQVYCSVSVSNLL